MPWTLIKRVIDSSDYYLLVVGGKYGSVDPETELSYTEMEYDYAVAERKPVMAFLHADPDKIEHGKSEKNEAAQARLEAFRTKVKAWRAREALGWGGRPFGQSGAELRKLPKDLSGGGVDTWRRPNLR